MTVNRRSFIVLGTATAIGAAASATLLPFGARAQSAAVMTPTDAHQAAENVEILLVDIRRPDEWAETGIGEFAVPLDLRSDDFIDAIRRRQRDANQPVGLICARGVRSARMTMRLERAGFNAIIDVPEGMLGSPAGPGWLARALPTVPYEI